MMRQGPVGAHPVEVGRIDRGVFLPPDFAGDHVTRRVVRALRADHLSDGVAMHHVAALDRRLVRGADHPGAVGGVQREQDAPH